MRRQRRLHPQGQCSRNRSASANTSPCDGMSIGLIEAEPSSRTRQVARGCRTAEQVTRQIAPLRLRGREDGHELRSCEKKS